MHDENYPFGIFARIFALINYTSFISNQGSIMLLKLKEISIYKNHIKQNGTNTQTHISYIWYQASDYLAFHYWVGFKNIFRICYATTHSNVFVDMKSRLLDINHVLRWWKTCLDWSLNGYWFLSRMFWYRNENLHGIKIGWGWQILYYIRKILWFQYFFK